MSTSFSGGMLIRMVTCRMPMISSTSAAAAGLRAGNGLLQVGIALASRSIACNNSGPSMAVFSICLALLLQSALGQTVRRRDCLRTASGPPLPQPPRRRERETSHAWRREPFASPEGHSQCSSIQTCLSTVAAHFGHNCAGTALPVSPWSKDEPADGTAGECGRGAPDEGALHPAGAGRLSGTPRAASDRPEISGTPGPWLIARPCAPASSAQRLGWNTFCAPGG